MKIEILSDLNFDVRLPSGKIHFLQLVMDEQFDKKDHYIPKYRPPLQNELVQQSCGFIAFWSGIKSSDPSLKIPPIHKDKLSLLGYGKKIGITGFGPIYNVEHFNKIAQWLDFKGGKAVLFSDNKDQYIKEICNILKAGSKIIIAADVDNGFPSNQKGEHSHWALIYGYFFYNDECFLLIAQYDSYYGWSANKLFESNQNLPLLNPAYGKYYKDKNTKSYHKITEEKTHLSSEKLYSIEEKDLSKFRFYGFCIPAKTQIDIHNNIDASIAETEKNIFSDISQSLESSIAASIRNLLHFNKFCNTFIDNPQAIRVYQYYLTGLKLCINSYISKNRLKRIPAILEKQSLSSLFVCLHSCLNEYKTKGEMQKIKQIKEVFTDIPLDLKNQKNTTEIPVLSSQTAQIRHPVT